MSTNLNASSHYLFVPRYFHIHNRPIVEEYIGYENAGYAPSVHGGDSLGSRNSKGGCAIAFAVITKDVQ